MRKSELQEIGGFVSEVPVEREVAWTRADGEQFTFNVLIRQLPYAEFEEFADAEVSNMEKMFRFLAKAVMLDGDDGLVALGYDDAKRLNQGLAVALVEAAQEVNGLGKR